MKAVAVSECDQPQGVMLAMTTRPYDLTSLMPLEMFVRPWSAAKRVVFCYFDLEAEMISPCFGCKTRET